MTGTASGARSIVAEFPGTRSWLNRKTSEKQQFCWENDDELARPETGNHKHAAKCSINAVTAQVHFHRIQPQRNISGPDFISPGLQNATTTC